MASQAPGGRLPLATLVTFSMANLPVMALTIAVLVYLPPYFAGHLAVPMATIGGVWMAIRLIDIPVDVTLALAMDRTRSQLGRYRVWLILGAPVVMLGLHQLFMAPRGFGAPYLTTWLLVLYLGWSMLSLAQAAWGATLATLYHERSRLFGVLAAVGVVGAVAVLLIPILGGGLGLSDTQSIRAMGWALVLAVPIAVAVTALWTPERVVPQRVTPPARIFAPRAYLAVLGNRDLLRLLVAQIGTTLGPGWMSALYLFFARDALGFSLRQASILLALYVLAGFPGALGVSALARRIGKHRAFLATACAYSAGLLTVLFVPRGDLGAAVAPLLWSGATAAGFGLMIQAMLADVGDEVRLVGGQERMSLLYALNGLAQKIATAFSIGVTFPLLAALGYRATEGAVNGPAAIGRLTVAFIAGPIGFVLLGAACVLGWRLDAGRQGEVRRALDAREAAESCRAEASRLTGTHGDALSRV